MAKEISIQEIVRQAGYEPLEERAIIVSYAPVNLSDRIARFFSNRFYVLQICRDAIVLLPLDQITARPENEVTLGLPAVDIQSVSVTENLLNYHIRIRTGEDTITLSTQQKELSAFRASGTLGAESPLTGGSNWHCKNLEGTLAALRGWKTGE